MLSNLLRPNGFETWEKEDWDSYRNRLGFPADEAIQQFYRQVVYDHFDHYNNDYPDFNLEDYAMVKQECTAQEANDLIRFFRGETMDGWGIQSMNLQRKTRTTSFSSRCGPPALFRFPRS